MNKQWDPRLPFKGPVISEFGSRTLQEQLAFDERKLWTRRRTKDRVIAPLPSQVYRPTVRRVIIGSIIP